MVSIIGQFLSIIFHNLVSIIGQFMSIIFHNLVSIIGQFLSIICQGLPFEFFRKVPLCCRNGNSIWCNVDINWKYVSQSACSILLKDIIQTRHESFPFSTSAWLLSQLRGIVKHWKLLQRTINIRKNVYTLPNVDSAKWFLYIAAVSNKADVAINHSLLEHWLLPLNSIHQLDDASSQATLRTWKES